METKQLLEKIKVAEAKFIQEGLLLFKEVKTSEGLSLKDFLNKLINEYIPKYNTHTVNPVNYIDCNANLHRSVEDIFRLTKYYVPNCTLLEVCFELSLLCRASIIRSLTCCGIDKITFFNGNSNRYIGSFLVVQNFDRKDLSLDMTQGDFVNYFTEENYKTFQQQNTKKQVIMQDTSKGIAKIGGFRTRVYSRHPSHKILRTELPKLRFQSVFRLGSITEVEDTVENGGRAVEINSIQAVKNSANKRLMKECFVNAGVKTADWYLIKKNGQIVQKLLEEEKVIDKKNLPFPLIIKSLHGSRGAGNTLIKDLVAFDRFVQGKDMSNYIVEAYKSFSREYRAHVTDMGCFYTCRKMLKRDTPENERFQRHDSNCSWILEENPMFDKPSNWNDIIADCVKALEGLGGDVMAFDIKVQSTQDSKGNTRKNPEWILLESCSAASFGDITAKKYIEIIPQIATKKALELGIIK